MSKRKQTSFVSAIGGFLSLLGGIVVIISQISIYFFVLDFLVLIGTIPPELQPLYRTLADHRHCVSGFQWYPYDCIWHYRILG
jgi:hypothetical protein